MDESICTNVGLSNIQEILIEGETDGQCTDSFEFAAKDSTLNKIPENVKKIYLENCIVTSLVTNRCLENFALINSNISVIHISGPFSNNKHVKFQDSRIDKVEKLILDNGSVFTIKNSRIVNVAEDGILIHPNVVLSIENLSGDFKYRNLLTFTHFYGMNDKTVIIIIIVFGCVSLIAITLLIIAAVIIVRYKRSDKKNEKGDLEHEPRKKADIRNNEVDKSNTEGEPLLDKRIQSGLKEDTSNEGKGCKDSAENVQALKTTDPKDTNSSRWLPKFVQNHFSSDTADNKPVVLESTPNGSQHKPDKAVRATKNTTKNQEHSSKEEVKMNMSDSGTTTEDVSDLNATSSKKELNDSQTSNGILSSIGSTVLTIFGWNNK